MSAAGIWAVVPVKDTTQSKQRLAGTMAPALRSSLALAMLQDVLASLAQVKQLAGIAVVTIDPAAAVIAAAHGAAVLAADAAAGHTAAIAGAARHFRAQGAAGMLALPGDIPLVAPAEISALLEAHGPAPAFTIVPAWDGRGSNAVLCSPPGLVALRFGDDSFLPHLEAARAAGLEPSVLRLPGIALDIDTPRDLAAFLEHPSPGQTTALLRAHGYLAGRKHA
jgi:2-phospho-L-lactate guanylyltransferase